MALGSTQHLTEILVSTRKLSIGVGKERPAHKAASRCSETEVCFFVCCIATAVLATILNDLVNLLADKLEFIVSLRHRWGQSIKINLKEMIKHKITTRVSTIL